MCGLYLTLILILKFEFYFKIFDLKFFLLLNLFHTEIAFKS